MDYRMYCWKWCNGNRINEVYNLTASESELAIAIGSQEAKGFKVAVFKTTKYKPEIVFTTAGVINPFGV